jgi:hypothetical protein
MSASADLAQTLLDHFAREGGAVLDSLARHYPLQYARLVGRVLPRAALALPEAPAEAAHITVTIAPGPPPLPAPPEAPAAEKCAPEAAPKPTQEVWRGPRW